MAVFNERTYVTTIWRQSTELCIQITDSVQSLPYDRLDYQKLDRVLQFCNFPSRDLIYVMKGTGHHFRAQRTSQQEGMVPDPEQDWAHSGWQRHQGRGQGRRNWGLKEILRRKDSSVQGEPTRGTSLLFIRMLYPHAVPTLSPALY